MTLFSGETGQVRALMNASAITAIRTAAVSAVATRLLARDDASELAIVGAGVQGRSHIEAMRAVRPWARIRIASRTHEHAQALADETGAEAVESVEEAVRGADVVVTATNSSEPVLRHEWLKPGAHVNAVGSSVKTARELDTATMAAGSLFVDRRESTLNEAGRLPLRRRGGRDRPRSHQGRDRRDPHRQAPGAHLAGRADRVQVARPRRRGPGRGRVRRPPRRETRRRHDRRVLIPLDEIRRARETIAGAAIRTPLVRLPVAEAPGEIWLKLENLQPIGSFKIRGATNAIRQASPEELAAGVVTASAGNMAQGVAWAAREAGVPATIVVPDHAPQTKIDAIERLGGRVIKVPHARWWQTMEEHRHEGVDGLFVHPVEDETVMAGNGTIGLEVLEDLPDADAVVIPYGGGGLTAGIASAVKALRPETKVFTVEPETGAPFAASFAAGSAAEGRVHAVVRRRRGRAARAAEDVGHRLASSSTAR